MNLHDLISKILEIANYPNNKRQEFIDTFYEYYFSKIIKEVGAGDPPTAQKLATASQYIKEDPEKASQIWQDVMADESIKQIIERVTNEVLGELSDDVAKWATEEQKQQILAILP